MFASASKKTLAVLTGLAGILLLDSWLLAEPIAYHVVAGTEAASYRAAGTVSPLGCLPLLVRLADSGTLHEAPRLLLGLVAAAPVLAALQSIAVLGILLGRAKWYLPASILISILFWGFYFSLPYTSSRIEEPPMSYSVKGAPFGSTFFDAHLGLSRDTVWCLSVLAFSILLCMLASESRHQRRIPLVSDTDSRLRREMTLLVLVLGIGMIALSKPNEWIPILLKARSLTRFAPHLLRWIPLALLGLVFLVAGWRLHTMNPSLPQGPVKSGTDRDPYLKLPSALVAILIVSSLIPHGWLSPYPSGALGGGNLDRPAVVDSLIHQQLPNGGFIDGSGTENIRASYYAVKCLGLMSSLDRIDRADLVDFVASLREVDGSYRNTFAEEDGRLETRILSTSAAVLILDELGMLDLVDISTTAKWLVCSQDSAADPDAWLFLIEASNALGIPDQVNVTRYEEVVGPYFRPEGGFAFPGYPRNLDFTYAIVSSFSLLGIEDTMNEEFLNLTARWIASLQQVDGSFRPIGGGGGIQDLFSAVESLRILGQTELINATAASGFAVSCQYRDGVNVGGVAASPVQASMGSDLAIADPANAFYCVYLEDVLEKAES